MNEHDTLPPGGMGPLDPTDIRDEPEHAISIDRDFNIRGSDKWSCSCGVDGFDMYDLATHANDVFDVLPA